MVHRQVIHTIKGECLETGEIITQRFPHQSSPVLICNPTPNIIEKETAYNNLSPREKGNWYSQYHDAIYPYWGNRF